MKPSSTPSPTSLSFQIPHKQMKSGVALAGYICPCFPRPRQPKQDPSSKKVKAEGFEVCVYTGLVTPNMPHMVGGRRVADVLLNHRLKWQLLRGSATPRGQRLFSKPLSCLAFMPHSWKKKCEQQLEASFSSLGGSKRNKDLAYCIHNTVRVKIPSL